MATRSITGSSYKYEPMERKDIVYYRPGNDDLWRDNYKQIPEGNGSIVGKIFINDNPAKDLEFSLILASGQKTKKTKVNIEGDYNISLPKGKYYFNGIVIYNKGQDINDKFLINKISKEEGLSLLLESTNNELIQNEFSKLEKELGAKEAAKLLLKSLVNSPPFRDKFPFEIGDTPFKFPDFHYRNPITILSPANNSKLHLDSLKFIWEPVETASYYKVSITNIEKKGTTTSYHNVFSLNNIANNYISYAELFNKIRNSEKNEECEDVKPLKPKKIYGLRVLAFNADNQIITASSTSSTELVVFTVKE